MSYAIAILEKERQQIVCKLKQGNQEYLNALQQLDMALGWLRMLQSCELEDAKHYEINQIKEMEGHNYFECYHLMIDNETDDISCWEEYKKPDGTSYVLSFGDLIITAK